MARKQQRRQAVIEVKSAQPTPANFVDRVFLLPRFARILLVIIPALAVTFIFSPVIDEIYLRFFYTPQTAELPAWIAALMAVGMYLVGWYYVVGMVGEEPTLRRETRWYLILSAEFVLLALVRFIILTVMSISGSAP